MISLDKLYLTLNIIPLLFIIATEILLRIKCYLEDL